MKNWVLIFVALAGVACSRDQVDPPVADTETVRVIKQGQIIGFVAENGAHVWRGVPFAASTAGENRWRAPQQAAAWDDLRETLQFAERCTQMTNSFDADEGLKPGQVVGSEDCLAVNVFAPANAQRANLPVMVWIHGGGNVWGKSSDYDGSRLAKNENVIVVAVQYRLGPLGWFAHRGLRADAIDSRDAAASFAILDLIASLEWVRENIVAFGGDPENVTIFGESAGGHNVAALLASPLSEGLFHQAIIQSGFFDSVSLAEAQGDEGARANPSNLIAEKLSATTADDLRALPVDTLLRAYNDDGAGFVDVPRMIQDGVALPKTPLRAAFEDLEAFHDVPIITGVNRDEMKLFYSGDERFTKKRFWFFISPRDKDFYEAISEYVSRAWRVRAVDEPISKMIAAGHDRAYAYRFDWDDSGRFLLMDFRTLFGASHGFEIPFLFNSFTGFGLANDTIFSKETESDRQKLSRAMGHYWGSFARDGAPTSMTAPAWPTYGRQASLLTFDTENDGGISILRGADSFDAIERDLIENARLSHEERCLIIEEIGEWTWLYDEPPYEKMLSAAGCDATVARE